MKFTVLGSGTTVPHAERSSSGYWLETAKGSLMLDFSASVVHRIAQEKLDWANLDAIWISHFHLDHIGGLAPFLFGTKYAPQTQERRKSLKIFGPEGLKDLLEKFKDAVKFDFLEQPFPLEIMEIKPLEKFQIFENLEAVASDTPHTDESLAIHLHETAEDKTLVFTADTGFTKTLSALARDVDLFICECSFVKNKPVETHLELTEAMYLVRRAEPKKAVFTHLYPEWDAVDFQKEIAEFSPPCEVLEAKDSLKVEI